MSFSFFHLKLAPRTRRIILVALFFLAGFLFGGVAGIGLTAHYIRGIVLQGPEGVRVFGFKRISAKLNLAGEQREQVRAIYDEAFAEIMIVRKRNIPEMERIAEKAITTIKEHLTPDQQKILDEMHSKMILAWHR